MEQYTLFHTVSATNLAQSIASDLGLPVGKLHSEKFSDGEMYVRFEESVRGQTVVILGQVNMPYENLFELFLIIDAARRASAREIIVITPYLPHSRQERKDRERTSIAARMVAEFIESSGANRLMVVDLHSNAIEGFFKIPVDHLDMMSTFARHLKKQNLEDLCLCSPDFGGLKRIKGYKKTFDCDMAVIHKERLQPNQVANMEIIGDVQGKNVVIIDDMIDTAGTLCKAADLIMSKGAKTVTAYATHGLLSGKAIERLENSPIQTVYVSDTINQPVSSSKIQTISCDYIVSRAIERLLENKSIKELNEELI